MKILMITSSYPLKDDKGWGPFIKNCALSLMNLKDDIEIIILVMSLDNKYYEYYETSKIKIITYPYSFFLPPKLHCSKGLVPSVKKSFIAKLELPLYFFSTIYYILLCINKYKPDVVHSHWFFPSGLLTVISKCIINVIAQICSLLNIKSTIYNLQSTTPLIVTAWGGEFYFPKWWIVKKMMKWIEKNASAITTVSNFMKGLANDYGLNSEKIVVIPNGINVDSFKLPTPIINLQPANYNLITIGTVRRLVKEKRIEDLIFAVSELVNKLKPNIRLIIVGDGPELSRLKSLSVQLKINDIVEFKGWLPNEEVIKLYTQFDIFVNPSVQEGLATVNLEAMSAGVPVIACKGYGNEDVIIDGETGFLYAPGDISALVDCLEKLIFNNELRKNISKKGYEKVKKEFSLEIIGEKYYDLYKSTLKEDK